MDVMKTVDPPDRLVAGAAKSGWQGRAEEHTSSAAEWDAYVWMLQCMWTEAPGSGK